MPTRQTSPQIRTFALALARVIVASRTQLASLFLMIVFFVLALIERELVVQAVLASVAASFMFTFVYYSFDAMLQRADRRHFRRFFGKCTLSNELYLVYPAFILSGEASNALAQAKVNPQMIYAKSRPIFSRTYRIDIPHVVAENDIQGLVYIVSLLGDTCRLAPPIRVDAEAVARPHESFMSFGLSSNECTHMYLQMCPNPMFAIVPDGRGSEYLTYVSAKGERKEIHSTPQIFYGLIVKYRPDTEEAPDRHWFLCAGLGPNGTSGAAWYLANRWRKIYRHVGDSDFLAVIKVHHYSDSASELYEVVKRDEIPAGAHPPTPSPSEAELLVIPSLPNEDFA